MPIYPPYFSVKYYLGEGRATVAVLFCVFLGFRLILYLSNKKYLFYAKNTFCQNKKEPRHALALRISAEIGANDDLPLQKNLGNFLPF